MASLTTTTETLTTRVAENLRTALERRGVSGRELARRLEVSPQWVSFRITGQQSPTLNDLERIAEALGSTVAELMGSEGGLSLADLPEEVAAVLETAGDRKGYSVSERRALLRTVGEVHAMFLQVVPRRR